VSLFCLHLSLKCPFNLVNFKIQVSANILRNAPNSDVNTLRVLSLSNKFQLSLSLFQLKSLNASIAIKERGKTSDYTGVAQLWHAEESFTIARGLENRLPKKGWTKILSPIAKIQKCTLALSWTRAPPQFRAGLACTAKLDRRLT